MILKAAGCKVALRTNNPKVSRNLPFQAAAASAWGLGRKTTLRALTIDAARILNVDEFTNSIKAGKAANHLLTATLWTHQLSYPGTRDYYNRYINKYSIAPDYHGAEAYSALMVAADVLRRADSFSPESIRAALDNTDMMTPFGPVKFRSYENFERQNSLPTQVLQIMNGKFECVWPEAHANSNFIPPSYWRTSD